MRCDETLMIQNWGNRQKWVTALASSDWSTANEVEGKYDLSNGG